ALAETLVDLAVGIASPVQNDAADVEFRLYFGRIEISPEAGEDQLNSPLAGICVQIPHHGRISWPAVDGPAEAVEHDHIDLEAQTKAQPPPDSPDIGPLSASPTVPPPVQFGTQQPIGCCAVTEAREI